MPAFSRFSFAQEPTGEWFAVIPEYPGLRGDLEMVAGADLLLSALATAYAPTPNAVTLVVSAEPFAGQHGTLTRIAIIEEGMGGGASYEANMTHLSSYTIWLCDVLKWALGDFPEKLYFCAESL